MSRKTLEGHPIDQLHLSGATIFSSRLQRQEPDFVYIVIVKLSICGHDKHPFYFVENILNGKRRLSEKQLTYFI